MKTLSIFITIVLLLAVISNSFSKKSKIQNSEKKIKSKNLSKTSSTNVDLTTPLHYPNLNRPSNRTHIPQGSDLKNHFGAPSFGSPYGSKTHPYTQYVEANPETFMPFKFEGRKNIEKQLKYVPYEGAQNKMNPHVIKSGDMTNIAPNAQKIVTPQIATPKLNIKTEIEYPAEVHLPTFKGMKKEFMNVTAYDKQTGRIIKDKVVVNRPVYTLEKTVMNVKRQKEEFVDLRTGQRLYNNNTTLSNSTKYHGQ